MVDRRRRGAVLTAPGRARPPSCLACQTGALVLLRLAVGGLGLVELLLRHRIIGVGSANRGLRLLRPLVALSRNLLAR